MMVAAVVEKNRYHSQENLHREVEALLYLKTTDKMDSEAELNSRVCE